jgi:hypothetical protein
MVEMKTYLTEYTDPEADYTMAGPEIDAVSFDHAESKLKALVYYGMVPKGTEIVGELDETLELGV